MSSLVPDYDDSSDGSSSNSESKQIETHEEPATKGQPRLPPPIFTGNINNSVFVNPYLLAENEKIMKHLKELPPTIGTDGRVCWSFQKGRCRYGQKCKFRHSGVGVDTPVPKETKKLVPIQDVVLGDDPFGKGRDEDEPLMKKKRLPLTKGLVPNAMVMAQYRRQKDL